MPSSNFATFLIICPTSFFLGILYTNWAFDHHTLWNSVPPSEELLRDIESHYATLANSPPILPRLLHTIILTGICGFLVKLYRPSESNMLFDGASLVLYMVGVIMYGTNLIRGLITIESGEYGKEVGKLDSLRIMAATQVIMALVLVGVLVLQSGQWYAERKEEVEVAGLEEADRKVAEEQTKEGKAKKKN